MAEEVFVLCPHQSEHKAIDENNVNNIRWKNSATLHSDETAYFVDDTATQQFEDKIKQAQGIL